MKLEYQNLNTNKFHDEIITADITPLPIVESADTTTWITFLDINEESVEGQALKIQIDNLAAAHDPEPMPLPKTQLEILQETVDALVLAALEVQ